MRAAVEKGDDVCTVSKLEDMVGSLWCPSMCGGGFLKVGACLRSVRLQDFIVNEDEVEQEGGDMGGDTAAAAAAGAEEPPSRIQQQQQPRSAAKQQQPVGKQRRQVVLTDSEDE